MFPQVLKISHLQYQYSSLGRNYCLFVWFFLSAFGLSASAQNLFGSSGSNYTGVNSVFVNPALIADSRFKVHVNITTNDISFHNNYLRYKAPYSFLKLMTNSVSNEYRNDRGQIRFPPEYIAESRNGNEKFAHFMNDFRGPSFMLTLNDKNAIALTTRVRFGLNLLQASEPTAHLFRYGTHELSKIDTVGRNQRFAMNTNAFAEFGLSYGRIIFEDDDWFLKAGITLKREVGLYHSHLVAQNGSFNLIPHPTDPLANPLIRANFEANYGYTLSQAYKGFRPNWLLGKKAAGAGWGLDVGMVYEFRPQYYKYTYSQKNKTRYEPTQNKYQYRVSIAVMDLGYVNFQNPSYLRSYTGMVSNAVVQEKRFERRNNEDEIMAALDETMDVVSKLLSNGFRASLPTALHLNVDTKIKKDTYLNVYFIQPLTLPSSIGMKAQTMLSVTPRYEKKNWEVALPVSMVNQMKDISIGIAGRFGPLFMGTDHLGGILNIGSPGGINAYMGLVVPIFRKPAAINCPVIPKAIDGKKKKKKIF